MTDGQIHCARCGDFEPAFDEDWRCPECGSPDAAAKPTEGPSVVAPRVDPPTVGDEVRRGRRILTACCVLTALILVAPPVVGVVANVIWRLFLWGWVLIP